MTHSCCLTLTSSSTLYGPSFRLFPVHVYYASFSGSDFTIVMIHGSCAVGCCDCPQYSFLKTKKRARESVKTGRKRWNCQWSVSVAAVRAGPRGINHSKWPDGFEMNNCEESGYWLWCCECRREDEDDVLALSPLYHHSFSSKKTKLNTSSQQTATLSHSFFFFCYCLPRLCLCFLHLSVIQGLSVEFEGHTVKL